MFLKVLVDNNTCIDDYALGEPALAFYIEDDNKKILFDTGYSDVLINNAKHYNIDLNNLDYIIISHGHNDHTRGLEFLIKHYDLSNTILLTHPHSFNQKKTHNLNIGITIDKSILKSKMNVIETKELYQITKNIYFLGEVPRINNFENKKNIGYELSDCKWIPDYVIDDSALIYLSNNTDKLTIIAGCSHSGICNICDYSKQLLNKDIERIIGGFHLFEIDEQLIKTIDYFKTNNITNLYPSHCVSFQARSKINSEITINDVMVGTELSLR